MVAVQGGEAELLHKVGDGKTDGNHGVPSFESLVQEEMAKVDSSLLQMYPPGYFEHRATKRLNRLAGTQEAVQPSPTPRRSSKFARRETPEEAEARMERTRRLYGTANVEGA